MSAVRILEEMARSYANARTYADRGVVVTTFTPQGGGHSERRSFRTAFRRPQAFRYELHGETSGDDLVIWQRTPPAKRFWSVEGPVETVDLEMAIAGAAGISGGSAVTVPRLLMPELIESWALTDLVDPAEAGREVVEGVDCVGVRGRHQPTHLTVWLGADDLLIRKIHQTTHLGLDELAKVMGNLPADLVEDAKEMWPPDVTLDVETETLYFPEKHRAVSDAEFDVTEATLFAKHQRSE